MNDSRELFEKTGADMPETENCEKPGDMRNSVQNLETIINEGLRTALLEETPD